MCSLILILSLACMTPEDNAGDERVLTFVETSQKLNVSQLLYGSFDFESLDGKSSSPAHAIRGEIESPVLATGSYAFDEHNAVYKCKYKDSDILEGTRATSDQSFSFLYMSVQILTDGKYTCLDLGTTADLSQKIVRHSVQVFEDANQSRFRQYRAFTEPVGPKADRTRLTGDIAQWKNKNIKLTNVDLKHTVNGRHMVRIVFGLAQGCSRAYIVDPERGSLPIEAEDRDEAGRLLSSTMLTDLVLCQDRCWLPKTKTYYNARNGRARILRIVNFDVHRKPTASDFHMEFDEKVDIPDPAKKLVYKEMSRFSLIDRPDSKSGATPARFIDPPSVGSVRPPVMPGERDGSYVGPIAIGAGALLLIAAVFFLWKRYLR